MITIGASARPRAQFGGIVYDPTNYANAVLRYIQLQQQLVQLRQSYSTDRAQYNLAVRMAQNIQNMPARYRAHVFQLAECRRAQHLRKHGNVGQRHELRQVRRTVNAGYQQATNPLLQYNSQELSGMTPDELDRVRSQYASVELADGANVTAMATIGAIRNNAQNIENQIDQPRTGLALVQTRTSIPKSPS